MSLEELHERKEELAAELCRRDLRHFVRRAWPMVVADPLVWNWHLDAICLHLQAMAEGLIQRLLISIPPGYAKSLIASVLYPAWRWTRHPPWQLISASYAHELATRDVRRTKIIIQSEWYQRHFTWLPRNYVRRWRLENSPNREDYFENSAKGFRIALGVQGQGTGYRGHAQIFDDILKAKDAHSRAAREEAKRWVSETMSSRYNDLERGERVVIGQRLHEDDPYGFLLRTGAYVHLRLPSRYEPPSACPDRECVTCHRDGGVTPIGWKDPRTKPGELLFPAKFSEAALQLEESTAGMGALAFAGQHQQRPTPSSGGIYKRVWFGRRWHRIGSAPHVQAELIEGYVRRPYSPDESSPTQRFIVTDAAFKDGADNDKVAVGVFDVVGPDLYLLDFLWDQMDVIKTEWAIKQLRDKWSRGRVKVGRVCIEEKANGAAVITRLKSQIPGIVPIQPLGSKEARFFAAAPYAHAGNVWLPDDHPQTQPAVEEIVSVPKGARDDFPDMLAYAILLGLAASSNVSKLEGLVKW